MPFISAKLLSKAQKAKAKCEYDGKFSLGRKEHYLLEHEMEQMELWQAPMGYGNEQSVEAMHPMNDDALEQCDSQLGATQIKGPVNYIMLETSPKDP